MNILGIFITGLGALGLLLALAQSFRELSRNKQSGGGCLLVIFLSLFLLAINGRMVPGGPFVSIHGDVLPFVSCLTMSFSAVCIFKASPKGRRIWLLVLIFTSTAIAGLVIASVTTFWLNPFARGTLVSW